MCHKLEAKEVEQFSSTFPENFCSKIALDLGANLVQLFNCMRVCYCFRGDRRYRLKMRKNALRRSGGSAKSGLCTSCVGFLRGEGGGRCKRNE